jgi:hypothetical protein
MKTFSITIKFEGPNVQKESNCILYLNSDSVQNAVRELECITFPFSWYIESILEVINPKNQVLIRG